MESKECDKEQKKDKSSETLEAKEPQEFRGVKKWKKNFLRSMKEIDHESSND